MLKSSSQPARSVVVIFFLALLAAATYASTLMVAVSGSDSPYTADTGEFQVALAEWGTVHHTGYPLYMALGSPFVAALRLVGVPPAAGASIFSLIWEAAAVCGASLIIIRLTRNRWLAFAIGLTLALTRSIWVHAAIAEVYSMSMAITVALLWLTLDLFEKWDDKRGWALALLAGLGVAHHRLIAVGLPVIGLMLLPSALGLAGNYSPPRRAHTCPCATAQQWCRGSTQSFSIGFSALSANSAMKFLRWLGIATLCFTLGFLPYLDMPLRVWRGATWVYGRPDTWNGFRFLFFGTEVEGWQKPVFEPQVLIANSQQVLALLSTELILPGLIAAVIGALIALLHKTTRQPAILFVGIALSYTVFSILFKQAVLLEADLMTVTLCLLLGLGLGLHTLIQRWTSDDRRPYSFITRRGHLPFVILLAWGIALYATNRPAVLSITRDPAGVNYIRRIEKLEAPPGSVVMAPWGWRYFALSYAQRIDKQMTDWIIVDHRADFAALTRDTGRAYTAADSFYIFTAADFWAPRLGGAHLSSAGPGLAEIRRTPMLRDPSTPIIELGDGLALASVDVRPPDSDGSTDIVLVWTATAKPSRDYSTFVHVSDQDQITSQNDLIAQSDQVAPVYAWYATGKWSPGELVREDHVVRLPPDRPAKLIVVGMYYRDDAGNFVNLGKAEVRQQDGTWAISR